MDEWLVFLHILAAIVWMGTSAVLTTAIFRANRNRDRAVVTGLAHELDWVGPSGLPLQGRGRWFESSRRERARLG
jgi:Predicted integral membrane protein (DUF2269)